MSQTMTRPDLEAELGGRRVLQAEFDAHVATYREEVAAWLGRVANACASEVRALHRTGDVADGNVLTEVELWRESVKRLRIAQEAAERNELRIADALDDLSDKKLWKGQVA